MYLQVSLEFGKSTITNRILKNQTVKVGDISYKNKKGKNTTTSISLYEIEENTYLLDTPGFQTIDIFEIEPKKLDNYFIDLKEHIENCEFVRLYSYKRGEMWYKDCFK